MEVAVLHKNDAEITIREVAVGDENALLAFYRGLEPGAAYFFTPWPFTHRAMAAHIRDVTARRAIGCVAVGPDDVIVGHGFIQHLRIAAYLRWLARLRGTMLFPRLGIGLSSSVRGRGVGRQLMDCVLQEAKRRGLTVVRLGVHRANASALALYRAVGFRDMGEFSQQESGDSIEMQADLGA